MTEHISVLLNETLEHLLPESKSVQRVIDGTLGRGGHTRALLERGVEEILAFDLDQQAIDLAQENLVEFGDRVHIVHHSYLAMQTEANRLGWDEVDGILLDLGVSSMQLDTAERGFAFRLDGVLDMRFNTSDNRPTAADIVNTYTESDLADIFFKYGEERHARRIAAAIIKSRPHSQTSILAEIVKAAVPINKRKKNQPTIHPATRIFQALRIEVNDELKAVETVLPMAIDLLKSGGRLAVITFHSLEDRIVKSVFKEASTEIISPPGMASVEAKEPIIRLMNRKPIVPTQVESDTNPRSRSAKLRVVEKI